MTDDAWLGRLQQLLASFDSRARAELQHRLKQWPVDLSQNEVHEVVGSLLARQLTLAREIANSPTSWNDHVAPILLRAMADVFITLAWVLRDPKDRSIKFIHYGLGQEKLQLEHRRADLGTRAPYQGECEQLEATENWLNAQRATFLTDVNLGSWSGLSTRSMAEEAGCIDFYNYVYAPFSACTHSMWHHIARRNLRPCRNPLHRLHSVPEVADAPTDLHYLYLAGKYLQKTLAEFDRQLGTSSDGASAFDILCDGLEALALGEAGPDAAD